jgi:hypothetical protein
MINKNRGQTCPSQRPQLSIGLSVVGGGDKLVVLLRPALERQEIVVAAAAAGIAAANGRARLVDRAAALLGVEERADAAERLVGLAAEGIVRMVTKGVYPGNRCRPVFGRYLVQT